MLYQTEFVNLTERPAASKGQLTTSAAVDMAASAKSSKSRNWEIPVLVLNSSKAVNLQPQARIVIEGNEFSPYAPYSKITLTGDRDPDTGAFMPKVVCERRKDFVEPVFPELSLVVICDDMTQLNSPPQWNSGDMKIIAPVGIEVVVPCSFRSCNAKYSGIVYRPVERIAVDAPDLPAGSRLLYEGGYFECPMRTHEELEIIKKARAEHNEDSIL